MLNVLCRVWAVCGVGLLLASCSDSSIPKKNVEGGISIGESETLMLDGNPTTGYNWYCLNLDQLKGKVDVDISVVEKDVSDPKKETLCGAPVQIAVKCTGLAAGEVIVKLAYLRPWEKTPPLKTKDIPIKVLP